MSAWEDLDFVERWILALPHPPDCLVVVTDGGPVCSCGKSAALDALREIDLNTLEDERDGAIETAEGARRRIAELIRSEEWPKFTRAQVKEKIEEIIDWIDEGL